MLAAESYRMRLETGLNFIEFNYMLLQAYDFLYLEHNHGCVLQMGGNDQWGNLLSGVELVRKAERGSVHALTTPLITKSDGTKFGKTEGGAVWLAPDMMTPYAFYQFWVNTDDADVVAYLRTFTFRSPGEIGQLEKSLAERPQAREAQRALANDVTSLVHGQDATDKVIAASQALFGRGELEGLDEATLAAAVAELPTAVITEETSALVDLLVGAGLVAGRGAARRAIAEGGVSVNNRRIADEEAVLAPGDLLHGRFAVLRRGKRTLAVATRAVEH